MRDDAAELTLRGLGAMEAGNYEEAARAFHAALQIAPHVDGLYFQFASALVWRGLPTEALPALDRCASMRGPWAGHALDMATQIRRQLALPVHGMMILPGRAAPTAAATSSTPGSPATTLTGGPNPELRLGAAFDAVARRVLRGEKKAGADGRRS